MRFEQIAFVFKRIAPQLQEEICEKKWTFVMLGQKQRKFASFRAEYTLTYPLGPSSKKASWLI